jgi:Carboxypeptidase regulatory-like domain/TonB dependent receptor
LERENNMKNFIRVFICAISLFIILALTPSIITAQIGGGSIVGNITDPNSAVLPNATVTATDIRTNKQTVTTTNGDGFFEFPLLPAGRYVIEAVSPNFQAVKSQPFDLNTGTKPKIDLILGVQGVATEVTVTNTGQLVNSTNTELGTVIEQRKIEALPLNGRNFIQLLDLQPGASSQPGGRVGGRGGFELNGGYTYGNNILVDGVDASFGESNGTANDRSAGSGTTANTGAIINTLSVDAIQEFKTSSNAFSAEFGRATSGVLNITTKSGTNDFNGTLLYFLRNNVFDANSFDNNNLFNPGTGTRGFRRPALRYNQYGGNLGGPIYFPAFGEGGPRIFKGKDKLFFFFNYEGARATRPFLISGGAARVPTQLTLSRITNPNLRQYYGGFPSSCAPITGVTDVCDATRIESTKDKENTFLGRVDGNFGAHRTSVRLSYNKQDYSQPQAPRLTNDFSFPLRAPNLAFQDNWALPGNVLNEFRFGYNKISLRRNNAEYFTQVGYAQLDNGAIPADSESLIDFRNKTYSVVDNLTFVRGNQTIKFGTDVRFLRSGRVQDTNPTTFYASLNDVIANNPRAVRLTFGGAKVLNNTQYGFYAQDEIRLNKRLQINPGLRYEYYTPLTGGFNIQSSDPFSPLSTTRSAMYRSDKNNFAPRLGIVFDVFGNQKLVVRGGGAVSFQPPQPIYLYAHAFADPRLPFDATFAVSELPTEIRAAGFPYNRAFVQAILANPSLLPANQILPRIVTDFNRSDEYGLLFNASAQYAVSKSLAVQLSYTGTRSLNHPVVTLPNEPVYNALTNTNIRPRPEFGGITYVQYIGRIRYDAMQVSVNERFSENISADFYYTYSKSLTYGNPDEGLGTDQSYLQDPTNIGSSVGPKSTDVRHRIAAAHTVEIPLPENLKQSKFARALLGGFAIQGIYTYRSGQPQNIFAGVRLTSLNRVNGSRPDLVSGVDPYLTGTASNGNALFLNRAAFVAVPFSTANPTAGRYGNLSYNALRGPTFWNYDLSIVKRFRISETQRFDFRVEAFNVFNHANYLTVDTNLTSGTFGQITTRSQPRNIQFGIKYFF